MQRTLLTLAVLVLAMLLAWLLWFWEPAPAPADGHRPLALTSAPDGGDFQLDAGAGSLNLRDLRGKVVLIYFGYTACPDVCPTNLAFIAAALKGLTATELERVQVLFVSLDPERDDPRRLAEYAGYFHPKIRGLTGTPEQLAAAARRYGASYQRVAHPDSALGYLIDHSAYTYLVDPQGALVQTFGHATPAPVITAAIRHQLDGG